MKLFIGRDFFDNPIPPRVFLCTTGKKRICELQATNRQLNAKWSTYSEFSFEVQRTYVDLLTGETKVHPAYDKIEAPRMIFVEGYGYWCIQDVDDTSGDNDTKTVTCFSAEYTTSNKYLTNWHINTGEVDSVEVLYNESMFGLDYSSDKDSFYKFASGNFNPYENYYKRNYTDNDSYTYEQIQVANATEYEKLLEESDKTDGQLSNKLYVKNFPNVQFYNPSRPGLSLLHLVFDLIPEWKIGNVDAALWRKERKFSEDRISIYDFLMNNVSETFGCTFVWDSLTGRVNCYENVEDDDDIVNEASTRWETDVYISKSNLASQTQVKYSADNIKTKLVVTGSDGLDIREVNLGGNSIMDLSFYHNLDWMEQDLFDAYDRYLDELQEAETGLDKYGFPSSKYSMSYPDAVQGWVAANNRYHEVMHAIPSEENVLLVGDQFKKLFCVYSPIDNAYAKDITIDGNGVHAIKDLYYDKQCKIPVADMKDGSTYIVQGFKLTYSGGMFNVGDSMVPNSKKALIKKLNQYHVDKDINASNNDNILLKLRNASSDVATIRVYDQKAVVPSGSMIDNNVNYYTLENNGTYTKVIVNSPDEFKGGKIYTNNYMIQSITVYAESGMPGGAQTYTLDQWLSGKLTAEQMGFIEYNSDGSKKQDDKGNTIPNYTVSYIGTMGAYFVLAKDEVVPTDDGVLEVSENYLNACGVNLLKEKHTVYTSIFQTQTEAMFSQDKYKCIVQGVQPTGIYQEGTRWLDTNSSPVKLYAYVPATKDKPAGWKELIDPNNETISSDDQENYENYQRYLDNYNKLKAVQRHLVVKEREAEYCKDGKKVDATINLSDGSSLPEVMGRIAQKHLNEMKVIDNSPNTYSYVGQLVNKVWPLYTFTTSFDPITYEKNTKPYNDIEQYYIKNYYFRANITNQEAFDNYDKTLYVVQSQNPTKYVVYTGSYDASKQYYFKQDGLFAHTPVDIDDKETFDKYGLTEDTMLYVQATGHTFAIYLKNNVPYVSYANSQGVYNMIMEYIRNETDISNPKFFNKDQWIRLSPFIKEDEFTDSNFLLTGYESEEERISICKELMSGAAKELKTLCKPSLEFAMTMANILALSEFEPLVNQFQLGNFIRVEIRDGYVKRARLLEVNMNFDDLTSFDCTFGNLKTAKSEIDKHAELLSMAVTAGKQVAKSGNSWQKSVEKANKIEDSINSGLQDAALMIKNASGQSIEISERGLIGRKLIEGTVDQYEDEQVAIINNKLVFTADNWDTSRACFGKFVVDEQERWGVLSDAVISGYIQGSVIDGGSLKIGGEGGTFIVNSDGSVQILGPNGVEKYADNRFLVRLEYTGATVFTDFDDECIVTCSVYDTMRPEEERNVTQQIIDNGGKFAWSRSTSEWTPTYVDGKPNVVKVKHEDIDRNAQIDCVVDFDETLFTIKNEENE